MKYVLQELTIDSRRVFVVKAISDSGDVRWLDSDGYHWSREYAFKYCKLDYGQANRLLSFFGEGETRKEVTKADDV